MVLEMEAWDALRARRNVRAYGDEVIAGGHVEQILGAARRTPSSMNQQGWDFVVVTDRDYLRELAVRGSTRPMLGPRQRRSSS